MITLFTRIFASLTAFFLSLMSLAGITPADTPTLYKYNVNNISYYQNTVETALPQTVIYNMVTEHFTSPLSEGKTVKKAIVIGYDGCRADALRFAGDSQSSAINRVAQNGSVYLSYCGGVNYPLVNNQKTSTAPGWCSMLTGKWGKVTGVTDNSMSKSNDNLTMLTTLVEDGTIDSSAFYVSWNGHFIDSDSTYINEANYINEKALKVNLCDASDDDSTLENVIADVNGSDCSDFIFSIFEYTDHTGHGSGFSTMNSEYEQAFYDAESAGMSILDAIESRAEYSTEDWLIIITSDHGGYFKGHGSVSIQERMTFIAANKPYTIAVTDSGLC